MASTPRTDKTRSLQFGNENVKYVPQRFYTFRLARIFVLFVGSDGGARFSFCSFQPAPSAGGRWF